MNEYLKRTVSETIKILDRKGIPIKEEERILNKRQRNKKRTAEEKWKVIQEVQKQNREGIPKTEIAKKLKISRQTVYVYLIQTQLLEMSTNCILDDYIPMIKRLILEGKKFLKFMMK